MEKWHPEAPRLAGGKWDPGCNNGVSRDEVFSRCVWPSPARRRVLDPAATSRGLASPNVSRRSDSPVLRSHGSGHHSYLGAEDLSSRHPGGPSSFEFLTFGAKNERYLRASDVMRCPAGGILALPRSFHSSLGVASSLPAEPADG